MPFYKPTDAKGLYYTLQAVNEYADVKRTDKVRAIGAGETFRVIEIVRYGTCYYLKTADRTYITADKEFVVKA